MNRHFLRYWLPAIAWVGLIFAASTATFAAENTGSLLLDILGLFFKKIDMRRFAEFHYFVRKSAHFIEYFVLSVLWFRALRGRDLGWKLRWAAVALLVALLTASGDEIQQRFNPTRTGTVRDVILDMYGALAAQALILVGARVRLSRTARRQTPAAATE